MNKGWLYMVFIDVIKAFDAVDRQARGTYYLGMAAIISTSEY